MMPLLGVVELGRHHADEPERDVGVVREQRLEVGAVYAAQAHRREALDRVAVDVVGGEHAVPERLPVVEDVEDVFLAVGAYAKRLYAAGADDDYGLDRVALMDDDVALGVRRVTRTCQKLALGVDGEVGKEADVVHAGAARA